MARVIMLPDETMFTFAEQVFKECSKTHSFECLRRWSLRSAHRCTDMHDVCMLCYSAIYRCQWHWPSSHWRRNPHPSLLLQRPRVLLRHRGGRKHQWRHRLNQTVIQSSVRQRHAWLTSSPHWRAIIIATFPLQQESQEAPAGTILVTSRHQSDWRSLVVLLLGRHGCNDNRWNQSHG